ncbi:hypothetical protein FNU76_02010 [Chitinimonas arctica]|uniref:Class I SAM-dependent methyltransferase n=1 Tax=Chitinimonas arctica TaxID=2594795 RepID=A0A516SAP7_9NEIS|nr:class I SAM-dependent methyltransferase [Chitinimonas arctica]QDQ25222.1 hypothetical protein FNU76_02010 [Chitinimonas arctica]
MNPALLSLAIQLAAGGAALAIGYLFNWTALSTLFGQLCIAVVLSRLLGQPIWWQLLHALFAPAIVLSLSLALPPWIYLLAFVLAWLLFGPIARSRVPLYLSNRAAMDALERLLPEQASVLDVGAGTATVLARLGCRPGLKVSGVEHAWLPCLLGWLRLKLAGNPARLLWGDMMRMDLANYDVVYAFLSPAAMPALWAKARREMRSGSLLISNSFTVPDVAADEVIELNDWKGAKLHLWRMP